MSFDNDYQNRKDRRSSYYRSGRFDRTCRPNGGCPWCESGRKYSNRKRRELAEEKIREFLRRRDRE